MLYFIIAIVIFFFGIVFINIQYQRDQLELDNAIIGCLIMLLFSAGWGVFLPIAVIVLLGFLAAKVIVINFKLK